MLINIDNNQYKIQSIKEYSGINKYDRLIRKYKDNPRMLGIILSELNTVSCEINKMEQDILRLISLENYLHKQEL